MRKDKGFTLIELIVTMFIAAILLGIATPSFMDLMERNRVRTTTEDLVKILRSSRLLAVEQRNPVSVCGSSDTESCDHDWGSAVISVKKGQDGAADEIMATLEISDKVSISKNNNANPTIDFRVNGWAPWDQTTFTVCAVDGRQDSAYHVVVSGSGKIKMVANKTGETWC